MTQSEIIAACLDMGAKAALFHKTPDTLALEITLANGGFQRLSVRKSPDRMMKMARWACEGFARDWKRNSTHEADHLALT